MLVKMINKFRRKQMPGMTRSSLTIGIDVAFSPHRDLGNDPNSQNILAVVNRKDSCSGMELWIALKEITSDECPTARSFLGSWLPQREGQWCSHQRSGTEQLRAKDLSLV
ncbi:unnamed protein product [Symbiodinium natans]|uniref:Uncharacterized protein n=1 Tax=Symbiodinium natans TaxID=878477 RepID=A0A812V0Y1_9DINO|nr:unnamed protein product [Symbiodinium natans]